MPIQIQKGPIHLKENGEWVPMPSVFPEKGIDYWTDEDKQEIINEASKKGQPILKKKLDDYTYVAYYDAIDYEYANHIFEEVNLSIGGCSSVRKGNLYGRNFDWTYSNDVTFIVHTPRIADRYEVWGTAGSISGVTKSFIESGVEDDKYRAIPFYLVDGINEHGLVMNNNVVPLNEGNSSAVPVIESKVTLNAMMVNRYVLDHFKTAAEAVDYIYKYVTIDSYTPLATKNYALHWMIADANKTYIIEIVSNGVVVTDVTDSTPYMTNFTIDGVEFNADNTVYTPYTQDETHDAITTNYVEELGSGLERWNMIADAYSDISSATDMRDLMESLKYTNAYTETTPADVWYTEFVGINELNVASDASDFADVLTAARTQYADRSRDTADTWQTVHSVVYNINDLTMEIVTQEGSTEYSFNIEKSSGGSSDTARFEFNVVRNESDEDSYESFTTDVPYDEIYEAYMDGKVVQCRFVTDDGTAFILFPWDVDEYGMSFQGNHIPPSAQGVDHYAINVYNDYVYVNRWTVPNTKNFIIGSQIWEFDSMSQYNVGDYCYFENSLLKCKLAYSGTGEDEYPPDSHFEMTNVIAEISAAIGGAIGGEY